MVIVNYFWARVTYALVHQNEIGDPLDSATAARVHDLSFSLLVGQSSKLRCFEANYLHLVQILSSIIGFLSKSNVISCIERTIQDMDKLDVNKNISDFQNLFEGIKRMHLDIFDLRVSSDIQKLIAKLSGLLWSKQKKIPENLTLLCMESLTSLISNISSCSSGSFLHLPSSAQSSSSSSEQGVFTRSTSTSVLLASTWLPQVDDLNARLASMVKKGKMLTHTIPLQAASFVLEIEQLLFSKITDINIRRQARARRRSRSRVCRRREREQRANRSGSEQSNSHSLCADVL